MADFLPILPPLTRGGGSGRHRLIAIEMGGCFARGCGSVLKTEQTATVMQQTLHIFKTVELFRLLIIGVVSPLGQLQLQRLQALFEFHDPQGQGMGGLGEILCVASDPERNGFRGHNGGVMMPMTTHMSSLAKQGAAEPHHRLQRRMV